MTTDMSDVINQTKTELKKLLRRSFNKDEFIDLCDVLVVSYDSLAGDSIHAKMRELVENMDRSQRLPELVENCRKLRPNIEWPVIQLINPESTGPIVTKDEELISEEQVKEEPTPTTVPTTVVRSLTERLLDFKWLWAVGLIAILLVGGVGYGIWQNRSSSEPEEDPNTSLDVKLEQEEDAMEQTTTSLTVESHQDGDVVEKREVVNGRYQNLPLDSHIWGVVQTGDGKYWLQEHITTTQTSGDWSLTAHFGNEDTRSLGETYNFLAVVVPADSDAGRFMSELVDSDSDNGESIEILPQEAIHILEPPLQFVRGAPQDYWLADFWPDENSAAPPALTTKIDAPYVFQEWWSPPVETETPWTGRFARRLIFPEDGEHCFYVMRRGEATLSVDGQLLDFPESVDDWHETSSACIELSAGLHEVQIGYVNPNRHTGALQVWYDGVETTVAPPPTVNEWQASFSLFNGSEESTVWSGSFPGPFLEFKQEGANFPAVNFTAVFSQVISVPNTAYYTFQIRLDDGGLLYIDDQQVLDEWHGGPGEYVVGQYLTAGDHQLNLSYYEEHGGQHVRLNWEQVDAPLQPVSRVLFASDRDVDYEIYMIDEDGANPVKLTDNDCYDAQPSWSPNGRQIIYVSDCDGSNSIFVMDAAGDSHVSLNVDGFQPRWSPDGSRIIFNGYQDGDAEIYVMAADGSNITQLTFNDVDDWSPDWSPDGTQLVYETNVDGDQEIFVMGVDGSNPMNLSQMPDSWEATPVWSPDGSLIAFFSNRDGNDELYVMAADGTNQRRLTNNEVDDRFPSWSPNGRFLTFEGLETADGQLQIYRTDVNGDGQRERLTATVGNAERPRWSPPAYGYTITNLTDGDRVSQGALAVAGEYVWTGGEGGLVRWNRDDPSQKQKYTSDLGLPDNNVNAVLITDSTVWAGTGGWPFEGSGLGLHDFDEGQDIWRTVTARDGLGSNTIFDLYQDSQGRIWAGTRQGVKRFDGQRWQDVGGHKDEWANCIFEAADGTFWFCISALGIMHYDPTADTWQSYDLMALLGSENAGYHFPSVIVEGEPGELWVGTNAGVVHFDGARWQRAGEELDVWTNAAVRDVDGTLWFGTNDGLVRIDENDRRIYTQQDGLTGIIQALVVDDTDVLWAAGNGLNRYDLENDSWLGTRVETAVSNHIGAITQDTDGHLWFGHSLYYGESRWYDGVSHYNPDDNNWLNYNTNDGLTENIVHTILQDTSGLVWIGFDWLGGGVCRYDDITQEWRCFQADPNGLASDSVDSIAQTGDGALWFGTSGGGLSRFDGERWQTYTPENSGLLSHNVHCLLEDGAGALWITTDQGVNRYFYEVDEWVTFTTGNSDILADEALSIAWNGDRLVWLGTKDGLSRFDTASKVWHNFERPTIPAWISNCTQAIGIDAQGAVWVGSHDGVYRSTMDGDWLRLTSMDGLASNQVPVVFVDANNDLWLGTPNGANRVNITP